MTLGLTLLVFSVYVAVTASEIEDEALERAIIDEVEGMYDESLSVGK